jgi:integrase
MPRGRRSIYRIRIWRVPAGRIKTRSPHPVPLAAQALGILKELARWYAGDGR